MTTTTLVAKQGDNFNGGHHVRRWPVSTVAHGGRGREPGDALERFLEEGLTAGGVKG